MDKIMRIGTRRSALALAQTELFIERCRQVSGEEILYEIVEMSTTGDRILDRPLYEFAGKGMYLLSRKLCWRERFMWQSTAEKICLCVSRRDCL